MSLPIGKKIKIVRIVHWWDQADLAAVAGLARETIARIESGKANLAPRPRRAIEAAIGYELDAPHINAAFDLLAGESAGHALRLALTLVERSAPR